MVWPSATFRALNLKPDLQRPILPEVLQLALGSCGLRHTYHVGGSCGFAVAIVWFVAFAFGYSQAIATWEQKDPFSAPTPRAFHTMAWSSAAGGLYVFGGEEGSGVAASPSRMLIWGQVELRCY